MSSFNPYDLLDESGGASRRRAPKAPKPVVAKPVETPKAQQQSAQPKAAPAKNASSAPNTAAPAKKENDAKPRPQGDAPKGNKNTGKDGAVKRAPAAQQPRKEQQQASPAPARLGDEAEKPRERRDRDHRTHDRPQHRGRQFDRRSGTGRPANENKKDGGGKGNWGRVEDGQENPEVAKEVTEGDKEEAVAPEGEVAATEVVPPKEPEKQLLGLDEYYATLKNKTVTSVEAPKIRQAGEGVDQSAWADYAPLAKGDETTGVSSKKKKEAKKDAGSEKAADLLQFRFAPLESFDNRGRGRGGDRRGPRDNNRAPGPRGGGRGGQRPQQGGRGNYPNKTESTVNIDHNNQALFPSLGGSPAAPAPVKA